MAKFNAIRIVPLILGLTLFCAAMATVAEGITVFSDAQPGHQTQFSVGTVSPKIVTVRAGVKPIFVVGTDSVSIRWLRRHEQRLNQLSAIGFVIGPVSQMHLRHLRRKTGFQRLVVQPHTEALLKAFNIKHYPVLIDTARGLITQ